MKKIFVQCDTKRKYLDFKDKLLNKGYTPVKESFDRNDPVFVETNDALALFSVVSQACVKGNYILNFNDLIFE
jgi:hypothetical protein